MGSVQLLPQEVINQIAAGEVVEHPACVIKELVENAIDASASKITITLEEGGFSSLSVADNGKGMTKEDLLLAPKRHATSKLKKWDDLYQLHTMGFRGEAISSIAAVSKLQIMSAKEEGYGHKLELEAGKIINLSPFAMKRGTKIIAQSLFYNVPARKRFQTNASSSLTKITRYLSAISLIHPEVQFELYTKEKKILSAYCYQEKDSVAQMGLRIREVLGEAFYQKIMPIELQKKDHHIFGFIGMLGYGKKNRLQQYLFINKRWVLSSIFSHIIKETYGTSLSTDEHPIFVLGCNVPSHLIDVNIHPQKKEIRFQDPLLMRSLIEEALKEKLLPPTVSISYPVRQHYFENRPEPTIKEKEKPTIFSHQEALLPLSKKIVAQTKEFLLLEEGKSIYLFHIPTAYKKSLELSFSCQALQSASVQKLLFPLTFTLSQQEMVAFMQMKAYLREKGLLFSIKKNRLFFEAIFSWMKEKDFSDAFLAYLRQDSSYIEKKKIPKIDEKEARAIYEWLPEDEKNLLAITEEDLMELYQKRR